MRKLLGQRQRCFTLWIIFFAWWVLFSPSIFLYFVDYFYSLLLHTLSAVLSLKFYQSGLVHFELVVLCLQLHLVILTRHVNFVFFKLKSANLRWLHTEFLIKQFQLVSQLLICFFKLVNLSFSITKLFIPYNLFFAHFLQFLGILQFETFQLLCAFTHFVIQLLNMALELLQCYLFFLYFSHVHPAEIVIG